MILVKSTNDRVAPRETLVDLHLAEFRQVYDRVKADISEEFARMAAEKLCSMSRDLIYKANRITEPQARDIVQAFRSAASSFDGLNLSVEVAKLVKDYMHHVARRAEVLESRLQA